MKKLIKKILKEDRRQMYLDKIVQVMKNDYPLIKNLKLYGFYDQLSYHELDYVLSGIFGQPVKKNGDDPYINNQVHVVYDNNGYVIYEEDSNGNWEMSEFDENGNVVYKENWRGGWVKRKYGKLKTTEDKDWSMDVMKYTEKLNYDDYTEVVEHITKLNGDVLDLNNPSFRGKYWIEWGDGEIERY